MVTEIWVNIGSGNGLLPDGTKPLPEPMLTDPQFSDIHIRAISQDMPQPSITKFCLKITCLNFYSNFPGINELNWPVFKDEEVVFGGEVLESLWEAVTEVLQDVYVGLQHTDVGAHQLGQLHKWKKKFV